MRKIRALVLCVLGTFYLFAGHDTTVLAQKCTVTANRKLMESVVATFAQFDDDGRSDRSRVGMQAAFALGPWIFNPPLGYLPGGHRSRPSLVHDPKRAPPVLRAFEEVATGQYTKQHVLALVTRLGLHTRGDLREVGPQTCPRTH